VLARSVAFAGDNSDFGRARDELWREASGMSVGASASELLAVPALKDNALVQAIAASRDASGALHTTFGAVAGSAQNPAAATLGGVLAALQHEQGNAFADTAAVLNDPATRPVMIERALERMGTVRSYQASAVLAEAMIGDGSAAELATKYTEQTSTTVDAVLKVVDSLVDFGKGEMGRAVLCGNLAGAALSLVPVAMDLFGAFSSGPSPDEVILEQIQQLSQQVADFQEQVNERFDRVDASLDDLLLAVGNLSPQLAQLRGDIAQVGATVTGIYNHMAELQTSVDALQASIFEALANADRSQLRAQIQAVIGYRNRNGVPLPQLSFNNAATYLWTFARFTATREPEISDDTPDYLDPQGDANRLKAGIAPNINFLDELPLRRGWRTTSLSQENEPLPNVNDWALAARAYSQLLLENPGYVTNEYRDWLDGLTAQGATLARLQEEAGKGDTSAGTHSTLLNNALCGYRSVATGPPAECPEKATIGGADVLGLLRGAQQEFRALPGKDGTGIDTPARPLRQADGQLIDPWGSAAQTADLDGFWRQLHSKIPQCGPMKDQGYDGQMFAPQGMGAIDAPPAATPARAEVPMQYQLAHRLGIGTLSNCWAASTLPDAGQVWLYFMWTFTPSVHLATSQEPILVSAQRDMAATYDHRQIPVNCSSWGSCGATFSLIQSAATTTPTVAIKWPDGDYGGYVIPGTIDAGAQIAGIGDGNGYEMYPQARAGGCGLWFTCGFKYWEVDAAITRAVAQSGLPRLQRNLYAALLSGSQPAGSLASGELHDAAERLSGARMLVTDYATLALGPRIADDDTLNALLAGEDRLFDADSIQRVLTDSIAAIDAGQAPTADPVTTTIEPALKANGPDAVRDALAAAISAPAEKAKPAAAATTRHSPLLDDVSTRLALTRFAVQQGPSVLVAAPAPRATVTDATPTFTGTAGSGPEDLPDVTVKVFAGTDTDATPELTLTTRQADGQWSATAPHSLATGVHTVQAEQTTTTHRLGRSHAVTFTAAAPPPAGSGGDAPQPASSGGGAPSPGPVGSPAARPSPDAARLSKVKLSAKRFARKAGTRLQFTLSRATLVNASVYRLVSGRQAGSKCKAHGTRGKRCTARVLTKRQRLTGRTGANRVAFGKGLRKGRYSLRLATVDGSAPVILTFTVR
jgi:hypothetical protein